MRRNHLIVGAFSLVVSFFITHSLCAVADDALTDLQRHVDQLRSQQQNDGSRETKHIFNKARAEAEAIKQAIDAKHPTPTTIPAVEEVVRTHVRGGDGITFLKPEEIYREPRPISTPGPESVMVEDLPAPQYTKPPRCERGETKREDRPLQTNDTQERVLFDKLYLPEEFVPVDVAEVYGAKAELHPYGPKSGTGVYMRMSTDAVPCLPYRIRVTTQGTYYDHGDNAFKNYDKKPSGRGEFSKWIQQKLFFGK
jgi:hypothetical protein